MPRQKYHRDRVYQVIGEPGPGSVAVGYVRYSSELQNETSITTQKRLIKEFLDKKGWKLARWYEEPEQSAKYDSVEDRPVFAQLLSEAGTRFQVVVCAFSSRWARSMEAGYASLSRLRRARVWWATSDSLWDIDKVQQDGFDVAFAVDMQMNASYVRQLSKRTIAGKEDRALEGYHNGNVPFGYRRPEYPKAPDGAPSTWRPPRMPASPDPVTFPALVRIGELAAQGWADRAIADELEGYISKTARFGERLLTKDTVAAIRRSWFPCEFEPGCGYGTIETPSGELVKGKHQAAWPYELWNRMREVKANQYRRPTKGAQKRPHEFSRIIVCAACFRPLRVTFGSSSKNGLPYYRDTSLERKLPCPTSGNLSVRSSLVMMQFGDILKSCELPAQWREEIAERCRAAMFPGEDESERVHQHRASLEAEQKKFVASFAKGYISEQDLDEQVRRIQAELFALPIPVMRDTERVAQEAISVGETLGNMADYWSEATPEERRDMVWSLLSTGGLIYDLERHAIIGLKPRLSVLPVLALGLDATGMWEQHDDGLWLRSEYWPPIRENKGYPPSQPPSLTPAQQEKAIMLIRQGFSLRKVAELMGTSYASIHRLVKKEGIVLKSSYSRLTDEQQKEALALLKMEVPFREIAERFGVHHSTIWKLAKREGLVLPPRGEKLTPTQRKLTMTQQQEARDLIASGFSRREVARMLGVSRQALGRVLEERES
jgi:DNA invertase Pin-like site-specific DNA recombinase